MCENRETDLSDCGCLLGCFSYMNNGLARIHKCVWGYINIEVLAIKKKLLCCQLSVSIAFSFLVFSSISYAVLLCACLPYSWKPQILDRSQWAVVYRGSHHHWRQQHSHQLPNTFFYKPMDKIFPLWNLTRNHLDWSFGSLRCRSMDLCNKMHQIFRWWVFEWEVQVKIQSRARLMSFNWRAD